MAKTIGELTAEIRENNIRKGWRPVGGGPGENTWGDYVVLLHSEISEALEAYRDHRLADATEVCTSEGGEGGCDIHGHEPTKPQGVGSEFADVAIRLLDMCDVFGVKAFDGDMELGDVAEMDDNQPKESFGDYAAWLHWRAAALGFSPRWPMDYPPLMLRALVTAARHFDIDLEAEVVRKIAYNATRPYQHGGRTMAAVEPTPEQRFTALVNAIPDDPRDWWIRWISEETEWFLDAWESLGLPRLTMQDASGERLTLWCSDVGKAAEMLGAELTAGGIELCKGEYSVGIVQAEKGRRDA